MNYETESWVKLYVRESTEDKLLPVLNRALRDFLLRLAKSRRDGTILRNTESPGEDIAKALGASGAEADTIAEYVRSMLKDGYLTHRRGRLWITNFVEAQNSRTPGATRQKRWRAKKNNNGGSETQTEHNGDVSSNDPRDVSVASRETSLPIRDEERRSETRRSEESRDDAHARPPPRPDLLRTRILARDYEPSGSHWAYGVALKLTQSQYDSALRDLRDKHGGKPHDLPWLDDKFCAFLEQAAKPRAPSAAGGGAESRAERQARESRERIAQLEAEERATAGVQ